MKWKNLVNIAALSELSEKKKMEKVSKRSNKCRMSPPRDGCVVLQTIECRRVQSAAQDGFEWGPNTFLKH